MLHTKKKDRHSTEEGCSSPKDQFHSPEENHHSPEETYHSPEGNHHRPEDKYYSPEEGGAHNQPEMRGGAGLTLCLFEDSFHGAHAAPAGHPHLQLDSLRRETAVGNRQSTGVNQRIA